LQKQISDLAKFLSKVVVILVFLILIVGLLKQYDPQEMITTSVAVAVAAIPEGLVITLTVILTMGMRRILDRKAIVRKLISAETLGSVSVICTDKTGTITLGQLKVIETDFQEREMGELSAILCNNRVDSLETSLYEWIMASDDPFTKNIISKANKLYRLGGLSFSDKTKFTATLNQFNEKNVIFIFGAPEKVLEKCRINEDLKKDWEKKISDHGQKGRKIVGFAYKFVDSKTLEPDMIDNMDWNGIAVYEDPIRPSIHKTIQNCQKAGIRIKMITGDYLPTAKYVGQKIGLIPPDNDYDIDKYILTGEELKSLKGSALKEAVNTATVFARIDPLEKHLIVNVLKEMGEVVAMTGDGVNDAPALKASDIGVVVNEASDISKNTADIVLIDSNLRTIEHAVKEGRVIFNNIRKVVLFLLSGGFTEIVLIIGALTFGLPLPVTAAQLLWVNLIEDSLPALSLAFEKQTRGIMQRPPRKRNTPILDGRMKIILVTYIIVSDSILMGLFFYLNATIGNIDLIRTIIFLGIGIDSLLSIYAFKSLRNSIFTYNPFSNFFLNFSVLFGFAMFFVAIYIPWFNVLLRTVPLPLEYFLLMSGFGILNIALIEFVKFLTLKFWKETTPHVN
jgi:Ca2+-transporting ATPase